MYLQVLVALNLVFVQLQFGGGSGAQGVAGVVFDGLPAMRRAAMSSSPPRADTAKRKWMQDGSRGRR